MNDNAERYFFFFGVFLGAVVLHWAVRLVWHFVGERIWNWVAKLNATFWLNRRYRWTKYRIGRDKEIESQINFSIFEIHDNGTLAKISSFVRRVPGAVKRSAVFSWKCVKVFPSLFRARGVDRRVQKACDKLDSYLGKASPGYAFYIDGEWGSGKTYFILKEYSNPKMRRCYLSLFGVKNKRDFEHRLWKGILFPTKDSFWEWFLKIVLVVEEIILSWISLEQLVLFFRERLPVQSLWIGAFIDGFKSTLFFNTILGQLGIFSAIILIIWNFYHFEALKVLLKKHYLILDDFERAEAPCEDVLSWINEYIEHLKMPVVLIGNETEVIEKIKREHLKSNDGCKYVEHYKASQEKSLGTPMRLEKNYTDVCLKFLKNCGKKSAIYQCLYDDWFTAKEDSISSNTEADTPLISMLKECVATDFGEKAPVKDKQINLRVLGRCFDDFERMYHHLKRELKNTTFDSVILRNDYRQLLKDLWENFMVGRWDTMTRKYNFGSFFLSYCICAYRQQMTREDSKKIFCSIFDKQLCKDKNGFFRNTIFSNYVWYKIVDDSLTKEMLDHHLMETYVASITDDKKTISLTLKEDKNELEIGLPECIEIEMIHVAAGQTFQMGSPGGEEGRYDNETRHPVTIKKQYWIGTYPVTQEQYLAVMGVNPSRFKLSGRHPVEGVTYHEATAFCEKLNEALDGQLPTGYKFALPTEAQWECACRAETTTPYSFGNAHDGKSCNGSECNCDGTNPYGTAEKGTYLETTSEVGRYAPNPWGIYDMHGNVWEWCADWYGSYDRGTPDVPVVDPTGPRTGSSRVRRGGSWYGSAGGCRAANRGHSPVYRYSGLGFRLVLSSSSMEGSRPATGERASTATGERGSPDPQLSKAVS